MGSRRGLCIPVLQGYHKQSEGSGREFRPGTWEEAIVSTPES